MHALEKMAEMAINRQNRQTENKNSIEIAKGPFLKRRFLASNSNCQPSGDFSPLHAFLDISGILNEKITLTLKFAFVLFWSGSCGI